MFDDFFGGGFGDGGLGGAGGRGGGRAKPPQDLYPKGSKVGKLSEAKFPKKGSAHVWLVSTWRLLWSTILALSPFCSAPPPLPYLPHVCGLGSSSVCLRVLMFGERMFKPETRACTYVWHIRTLPLSQFFYSPGWCFGVLVNLFQQL